MSVDWSVSSRASCVLFSHDVQVGQGSWLTDAHETSDREAFPPTMSSDVVTYVLTRHVDRRTLELERGAGSVRARQRPLDQRLALDCGLNRKRTRGVFCRRVNRFFAR